MSHSNTSAPARWSTRGLCQVVTEEELRLVLGGRNQDSVDHRSVQEILTAEQKVIIHAGDGSAQIYQGVVEIGRGDFANGLDDLRDGSKKLMEARLASERLEREQAERDAAEERAEREREREAREKEEAEYAEQIEAEHRAAGDGEGGASVVGNDGLSPMSGYFEFGGNHDNHQTQSERAGSTTTVTIIDISTESTGGEYGGDEPDYI